MASRASGRSTSHRRIAPIARPDRATSTSVWPSVGCAKKVASTPCWASKARFPHQDLRSAVRRDDTEPGLVVERFRFAGCEHLCGGAPEDGRGQWMLRSLLCDGRRLQHFQDCGPWDREHLRDLGLPQRQRAGLVEDDGPHSAERLQVDTTLDDRADARRAPDAAEDGQRRSGCDATGACHDDDGDGGSDVARYEERETGARECEVDEVTG